MKKQLRQPPFWVGVVLGCGGAVAALELPYVNWHRIVPPLEARPLVIRADAKGDGRFQSSRSGNRRHQGLDLAAPIGSPVRAVRSGTVVEVGTHRGLGRFIELEHRRGLRSRYAHLQSVTVEPGARIRQGAVIGTVGKTGNARHPRITPHLHLELWDGTQAVDPRALGLQVVEGHTGEGGSADARGGE
jgi:murein DD-endopeptidase MepM/ murein hydrolase activator NlpD